MCHGEGHAQRRSQAPQQTWHSRKSVFQKPCVQSLWCSGKEPACQCRRHGFDLWVGKIPWRRAWQPTPVFLPGESHGPEPGGLRSIGSQRTGHGWSDWACTHITIASRDIPKEERKQSEIIQRAQKPLKVSAFARWVLWEQHPNLRPHCILISMTSAGYMLISSKQALLPQHRSPDCHLPEVQIPRMQWGWAPPDTFWLGDDIDRGWGSSTLFFPEQPSPTPPISLVSPHPSSCGQAAHRSVFHSFLSLTHF